MNSSDVLVIGSGIAGLSAAIPLAQSGLSVAVLGRGKSKEGSTRFAQGGIAAVREKDDSFEAHIEDTLAAGAGHGKPEAVRFMVERGPAAIRFLEEQGAVFQKEPMLEGGHRRPRVWRTSDFTGQDLLEALQKSARRHKSLRRVEGLEAVELIVREGRCIGAWVRSPETGAVEPCFAGAVVLATGGLGQLFLHTTNPRGALGDGLSMCLRAGLELADMEFIQFHPTALEKEEDGRHFLLSETLRGFGAKVINARSEAFLKKYEARAELAPRDVLARAIYFERMSGPVYLDLRHLDPKALRAAFPHITKALRALGFDIAADLLPIVPAAHYAMGGVPTDLSGLTRLPGLYAAGEVACTGVHGANRLASNSLLEAVVFGQAVAEALIKSAPKAVLTAETPMPEFIFEPENQVLAYNHRIATLLWNHAGLVRTLEGLERAKIELAAIPARDCRVQGRQKLCQAILEACLRRPASLGAHYITAELIG